MRYFYYNLLGKESTMHKCTCNLNPHTRILDCISPGDSVGFVCTCFCRFALVAVGFQNCVVDLLNRVKAEAFWRRWWKLTDVKAVQEDNRHEKDKALKNETREIMTQYRRS